MKIHLSSGPRAKTHPCGGRSHNGSFTTDNLEKVNCRGCQGGLLRRRVRPPLAAKADGYAVTAALRVPYATELANDGVRIHFWLGERTPSYGELAALVMWARKQRDIVAWTYSEGTPLALPPIEGGA